jgi:ankyrin repeat protein
MIQPDALKTDEYLPWSRGRGSDVWRMFRSAVDGDLATIRTLVEADPALATCEFAYFTPLHFAAREGRLEVVKFLVEHGADPTDRAATGWHELPLTMAKDRGHTELREWLEHYVAAKHQVTPQGEEIAQAIRDRDVRGVGALLDQAPERIHAADARGNQPIHWAVMTRRTDLIDLLLERGADLEAKRPDGARPLNLTNGDYWYRGWRDVPADALQNHQVLIGFLLARGAEYQISVAARLGDTRKVRELLDADPGLVNRLPDYCAYSGVPLATAAAGGHVETVRLLLERGADPNAPEAAAPHGKALYEAAAGNHLEVARLLLEHGANPNASVESSGDCCWRARRDGHQEMLDLLSSYGGAPKFANCCYSGWIELASAMLNANPVVAEDEEALGYAASEGHLELLRLFLRVNPDAARKLPGGSSGFATIEIARLLLDHGFDPSGRNFLGVTPLHFFAMHGKAELAALFLDYGADIHARDEEYSSTPLGWAARAGRREMVELLLERGAAVSLPDDEPWATPLAWAERRGHPEIAALLRGHSSAD